jgi:hypothetical protein
LDKVRLATPEEVKDIHPLMDITPTSTVVTFGGKDFAVVRLAQELDPLIFADDTTDKRKLLFLMNIETALRLQGVQEVYFNIDAEDTAWMEVAKHWGAAPNHDKPMIRFKKVL